MLERVSVDGVKSDVSIDVLLKDREPGAYESFRVHKGRVFLLDEHFARLKKSLNALALPWDDVRDKYCSWVADLCNDLPESKDAFVRFMVVGRKSDIKVIIHARAIEPFAPSSYAAVVLDNRRLDLPDYFSETGFRIKAADYIKFTTDTRKSDGLAHGVEGILLTPEGNVAEALTANIFWSKDGKLYTPPLDTGILAGTMRNYIMNSHDIEEILAGPSALQKADEIILTSGASYLRPLSRINDKNKPGADGPVFNKLYKKLTQDIKILSKPLN